MITVMPDGGLCNRLRVVASAWLLAQACKQPLRVLWYRTPDFNARFDALFKIENLPFAVSERNALRVPARLLAWLRAGWARATGAAVLGESETAPGVFDLDAERVRLRGRAVFLRTNSRLAVEPGMFDMFVPVGTALRQLEEIRPRLAGSVGVHVRRTDNVKAAAESTLARFEQLMRAELLAHPGVEFFVATDEPAVMQQLQQAFGGRVWQHPKRAYARNDPVAIADAVVDLYGLAHCRKLIGSYWSSFTDTAAELRGIECVVARAAQA